MGFHPLDLIVIVGIALLIFGPKTLQSISHTAGRGMGQAKEMKDKILSDLPMEELSKINSTISQIPISPQQVAQKLISSALKTDEKKDAIEEKKDESEATAESALEA
jgi:Sec-independent protein translocase protein TatA